MSDLERIDHLLWTTSSIDTGMAAFKSLTGVTPKYGGRHTDGLTENALASLGNRQYIEILACTDTAESGDELVDFCRASNPERLHTWCSNPPDTLDELAERVRSLGIAGHEIVSGGRETPDGQLLQWRLLLPELSEFGPCFPFFIDWGESIHPATTAPDGLSLKDFWIDHPRANQLNDLFDQLGMPAFARTGTEPGIHAVLANRGTEIPLSS